MGWYQKSITTRVGGKYSSKYLSQVQALFHICMYKYKFKYSEYLEAKQGQNRPYIRARNITKIGIMNIVLHNFSRLWTVFPSFGQVTSGASQSNKPAIRDSWMRKSFQLADRTYGFGVYHFTFKFGLRFKVMCHHDDCWQRMVLILLGS